MYDWYLLMVPMGAMGPFWPGFGPFRAVGNLWAVSKVESSQWAPHLPRLIWLVNISDTLLVVLILDMVYDCHL